MAESVLVGVLSAAIALLGMSTIAPLDVSAIGGTSLVAGLAGGACMVLGQG